jgi:hypothetical protein
MAANEPLFVAVMSKRVLRENVKMEQVVVVGYKNKEACFTDR